MARMPDLLILAHVVAPNVSLALVTEYAERSREHLSSVQGYITHTFWQNDAAPDEYVAIHHYDSVESAARGLERLAEGEMFLEAISHMAQPADVRRMLVEHANGTGPDDAAAGTYLSLGYRVSEPGMAQDSLAELVYIFQELQVIPGFEGSLCGRSDTTEEEVAGLVLWATREAFERSLPSHSMHKVTLFRKLL
jgi:heme-degrading monooxygenase HmoA